MQTGSMGCAVSSPGPSPPHSPAQRPRQIASPTAPAESCGGATNLAGGECGGAHSSQTATIVVAVRVSQRKPLDSSQSSSPSTSPDSPENTDGPDGGGTSPGASSSSTPRATGAGDTRTIEPKMGARTLFWSVSPDSSGEGGSNPLEPDGDGDGGRNDNPLQR